MSGKKNNVLLAVFYLFLIFLVAFLTPVEVDWSLSFDQTHAKPYGTKVLRTLLEEAPNHWEVETIEESLYEALDSNVKEDQDFLFLNATIQLDSFEFDKVMSLVADGRDAFISADDLPELITDTLNIELSYNYLGALSQQDSSITVSLDIGGDRRNYEFDKFRYYRTIDIQDDSIRKVNIDTLGWIDREPCFVRLPFGNGNFYVHSIPILFTNYHMLKGDPSYALQCIHHLRSKNILWEQYYLAHASRRSQSIMHNFLEQRSFSWAYWLTLFMIGVFVIFKIKREQRAIPIVEPYKNQSKIFAETIGRLYFNRGDHRNLSLKVISHFKEHIHKKYYMKDIDFTASEAQLLALKSGHEPKKIDQLFTNINNIRSTQTVTEGMLTALYKQLKNFYK